ncbi:sensor histidine kinase [Nocardioides kribbensis]|uniref:Histidine kinase n=1 Tax=Nocardioides kribbensis TaxID=305517 RepID=A0ABV1P1Q5_9ACTN
MSSPDADLDASATAATATPAPGPTPGDAGSARGGSRARRPRWKRWSERSEVERVDLYTRQSIYLLLWSSAGFILWRGSADWGEQPPALVALVVAAVAVTCALGTPVVRDVAALYPAARPVPWRSVGPLLAATAVVLLGDRLLPDGLRGVGAMVALSVLSWSVGGLRDDRVSAALVGGFGLVFWATTGLLVAGLGAAGVTAFFVFTARVSLWLLGVVSELDRARALQADLAVAEERLRFSRDVHDVLGRRLSAIALQSELAARLSERGDTAAAATMLEVRGVAHTALREARALARGYRATDLAQELEGARSLLDAAGIAVALDVADLPTAWHEPAGWVVRECVTNVLRHSAATRVEITYAAGALVVGNDGVGPAGTGPTPGSGLTGLRERLAPLGARLDVGTTGLTGGSGSGGDGGDGGTGRFVVRVSGLDSPPAQVTP